MKRIDPIDHPVNATVTLPGSKSYTNRALIIAAMAAGTSQLRQALFSDDTMYMAQALRELGIPVTADETTNTFTVEGQGRLHTRQPGRSLRRPFRYKLPLSHGTRRFGPWSILHRWGRAHARASDATLTRKHPSTWRHGPVPS